MKWSSFGRVTMAVVSALALGLGMTACGGGTIAYLWVAGQQYNEISGYQVDNNTGNLTQIPHSPFGANGSNPVYLLLKPGGRYLYVINQGTSTPTSNSTDSGIAVFSIGGDGSLTFQTSYPTQGFQHIWAQFDSSGGFLYVLDRYSPSGDGNGAITAFSSDVNTGRLILVPQTQSTPAGGVAPNYEEVGANPLMMAATPSCLYTVNQGDQTVTPFASSNGQLTTVTTGKIAIPNAVHITSINGNGQYMVLTDAGPSSVVNGVQTFSTPGTVYPYTPTASCGLTPLTAGVTNTAGITDPVYSFIDQKNANIFVLNASTAVTAGTQPFSQITGYQIVNAQLRPNPSSPFTSGPGPVCMVEDPTQKYMYIANRNDGSITGYAYDNNQGTLAPLSRGSTFTTGNAGATCLALSGTVN